MIWYKGETNEVVEKDDVKYSMVVLTYTIHKTCDGTREDQTEECSVDINDFTFSMDVIK